MQALILAFTPDRLNPLKEVAKDYTTLTLADPHFLSRHKVRSGESGAQFKVRRTQSIKFLSVYHQDAAASSCDADETIPVKSAISSVVLRISLLAKFPTSGNIPSAAHSAFR